MEKELPLKQKLARQLVADRGLKVIYNEYCPFCTKVQLAAGYLNITRHNIACGDKEHTIPLIGKHQVPILIKEDKTGMAESHDICLYLHNISDKKVFSDKEFFSQEDIQLIRDKITEIMSLTMHVIPMYRIEHPLHKQDFITTEAINNYKSRYPIAIDKEVDQEKIQTLFYELEDIISQKNRVGHELTFQDLEVFPWLRSIMILDQVDVIAGPETRSYYLSLSHISDLRTY